MLFIIQWSIAPENRNAVMARFAETGGKPPAELKVHGRWHAVGELQGFAVVESNDLQPVLHWTMDWSDLAHMQVSPAMTDTELAPILVAAVSKMTR